MKKLFKGLACLILFCFILSGCGQAIRVYSIPSGAKIYRNDVFTGLTTPGKMRVAGLSTGRHIIEVKKAGYRSIPWSQDVEIRVSVGNILWSWFPPILLKNIFGSLWKGIVFPRGGRLDTFHLDYVGEEEN